MIFAFCGCEDEEDVRNSEFSCKIDNVIWNADEIDYSGQKTVRVNYYNYVYPDGKPVKLGAVYIFVWGKSQKESIEMIVDSTHQIGIAYPLREATYHPIENKAYTIINGTLTLHAIDTVSTAISGIFQFTAKNKEGRQITVTDGRFSSEYN